LELEICDLARALRLDHDWKLIAHRNLRAQQIELAGIADLLLQLRLRQQILRLLERRLRDGQQSIGQRRIVIRRRHVQTKLRLLCSELDARRALRGVGRLDLTGETAAGEDALRARETERVAVHRTEADLAEIDSTGGCITRVVACDGASRVVLEARDTSELGRVAVEQILITRSCRTTWCRARR